MTNDKENKEVRFQQNFYYALRKAIESKPDIAGFKFSKIEMEWDVDGGKADIVIFDGAGKEFIVIETKRKNGKISRNIDPLSFNVIKQALGYAGILGASYIATANAVFLASFIRPERAEPFSIERHRVLITPITVVNEEFATRFLETVIRYHQATTLEEKAKLTTGLDWTFVFRLRSFVLWLATEVEPVIRSRLKLDKNFREKVLNFALERGATLTPRTLAEQMSYILTNKIVFYKVLERQHPSLPRLLEIKEQRPQLFMNALNRLFETAIQTTKDFEAVFKTGLFDEIVLPESPVTLLDVIDGLRIFIKDMETYPLEKLNADVIGHVYEQLLPDEERHRLGQFYTPPAIAEMICAWAIRTSDDTVLDPAVGSGTFIIKAYQRLRELKGQKSVDLIHEENVAQLYSIDINPFPAQLTAMNLAMRNVNHPISNLNILREDFFKIAPNQSVLSPYSIRTLQGEEYREIKVPEVSAVLANPPYTRWTELADSSRATIMRSIGPELSKFKMRAGATQSEPMTYLHFLIHGTHFLANGGRLAMIISDSWLQADYGIKFGKYLLSNFRIKGVIDFSSRVFPLPLVATLVVFLEKEVEQGRRDNNQVSFLFIKDRSQLEPQLLLDAIAHPEKYADQFFANTIQQKMLNSGAKWLNILFGAEEILARIKESSAVVSADKLLNVATSNTGWAYWALKHGSRTNLGTKQFFYLVKDDVPTKGLQGHVHRALPSARYAKFYSFDAEDWNKLVEREAPSYFFMCHKPKNELPKSVRDYIHWGETECRTGIRKTRGGGGICSKAYTCQERERTKERFFGWYDLGGSKHTPIMAVRQSQYRTRFFWCKENLVTYDGIVTFLPKQQMNDVETKAMLAFLNSSFSHLYVEAEGRGTALGLISLEVAQAERMPILNVTRIPKPELRKLAELFDSLEKETRKIGGGHKKENLEKLSKQFEQIDSLVADILKLPNDLGESTRKLASQLMERRLMRTEEAIPELLRGEEQTLEMTPPSKKSRKAKEKEVPSLVLDNWVGNSET